MATTIIHKKSSVVGRVPLASDLEVGELALNLADKKIYTKQVGGDVIELTSTGLQTSLGSWSLGSADAAGWAINESSDGTMLFISGITTIASLSPAGDFSVAGEVRTNTVVGGATINQLATELTVAGDVNAEDTITLGTATSFYFINGSAARMEITATGVLNLSGDIGANATF